MTLLLFPLVAYLAAVAYLIAWLIRQIWAIAHRVRDWRHNRKIVISVKTWNKGSEIKDYVIYLAGALLGGVTVLWLMQVFIREWLLVVFVALAILSEEMQISSNKVRLLEVMVFFNRLANIFDGNQDFYDALAKVIKELSEGSMQKAVRETILRRRDGLSFEASLKAMRGLDPLLDEFVLTLQLLGGQNGRGLNIALDRLSVRAGRRWDRASWLLLIKDKWRAYVQFSRGAFVAALLLILINSSFALKLVMPDWAAIFLAVLALLGLGFVFYLFLARKWLRRSLVIWILIIALIAYAYSLILPIPSWIQVKTISHHSASVGVTEIATGPVIFLAFDMNNSLSPQTINPPPTPAPSTVANTLNPPILITTTSIPQEFDACRLPFRQPR